MTIKENNKCAEMAKPTTGKVKATDPSIYEQLVQPWELCNTPIDSGNFDYQMQFVTMPGITFYREKFTLGCRVQGLSPANILAIGVPLQTSISSTYWGDSVCDSSLPITLPGGMDTLLSTGHDHLVLLIDMCLLEDYLPPKYHQALQYSAIHHQLLSSSAKVKDFGEWLLTLLNSTYHKSDILKYPAVIQSMREDLLRQLMDVIHTPSSPFSKPKLSRRSLGMRRVLEFLRETDPLALSIPEINKMSGVSLRTLEYGFRDTFGLTPLAYLRLQRMHSARRALLMANPDNENVISIACLYGFYQPTRFAIDYRRLFGEPPSKTLKNSFPGKVSTPLII